jgi:hypothetical protein
MVAIKMPVIDGKIAMDITKSFRISSGYGLVVKGHLC